MKDAVIPYTLPEVKDHSFFFIAQHITPRIEAVMHRHEAWELYFVTCGKGIRMTGDTLMPFSEGDLVLIPLQCLTIGSTSRNQLMKTERSVI